jgi:hypothetical protein
MFRNEYLTCLIDAGRVKSTGHFVTRLNETIEIAICNFDGCVSGFRWNDESGWEPIFLQRCDTTDGASGISLCSYTGHNPYTEDEIAFELECFFQRCVRRDAAADPFS